MLIQFNRIFERKSKRFFASDLIKVDNDTKNKFLEDFSLKDAIKLNKQDAIHEPIPVPIPVPVPVPVSIQDPKIKIDKLIGRKIKKNKKKETFVGDVISYNHPYYNIIYENGEADKMTRSSVFKFLMDEKNENPRIGLRKRKEVVIGGQIHFFF